MQTTAKIIPISVPIQDMPLNETDKAWIRQEIQAAHKRRGKLAGFIKDWGGVGAAVAILILIFTQWSGYVEFRTHTGDRLDSIDQSILSLRALLAATHATDKSGQIEASNVLLDARKRSIKLPADVVQQVAQSFIQAAKKEPGAWATANDFLDYRSFLNAGLAPAIFNTRQANFGNFRVQFTASKLPGSTEGELGVLYSASEELVPRTQSALFIEIGNEGEVVRAPRQFVIEGKGFNIVLDGHHIRNAIVRDATITYRGGRLILENVYFVNCTFELKNTPNGEQFADSFLKNVPTSFTA
jgi:hypothetical protein